MKKLILTLILISLISCSSEKNSKQSVIKNDNFEYKNYTPNGKELIVSRNDYFDKLKGFWLAQCIANWTGLVTEMDKVGNVGKVKSGPFYTRNDWGKEDRDFVFEGSDGRWGADDDTDIEYIYQHLLFINKTSKLTGEQIRDGWLKHIKNKEENFLWVSNQRALDLMIGGVVPPATSDPKNNPDFDMIDAQLTTEIFGFYSPGRPDFAVEMADLPIRTTARFNAEWISKFYVSMHSLAANPDPNLDIKENLLLVAEKSRNQLPNDSYASKMYDFVKKEYNEGKPWETIRDNVYQRYQVDHKDGYDHSTGISKEEIEKCNGCAAAGINFAASIISLFSGEGDLKETIKIASLMGWDSDNPTATWGGLIGFMIGHDGVEKAFNKVFSEEYNIHRTRQNFPNGIDNFTNMASVGVFITDRVVQEELGGGVDLENNIWYIPKLTKND